MEQINYQRMFDLIEEVFSMRDDPNQLQVNEEVIHQLNAIHPATLSEIADENGPLIWALLIPTTEKVMNDFLTEKISESQLVENTKPNQYYDSIYLCSVTTLPEQRAKGQTKKVCLEAIQKISADHPIKFLYVWAFTKEGEILAEKLSTATGLELKKLANKNLGKN